MTITSMAKQLNVSTMTIYRRCKKNGVAIDDLRDATTGDLTAEGVAVIASLFDATEPQADHTGDATQMQPGYGSDAQPASQGVAMADNALQVATLAATVDGLRALVDQLISERDTLREQVAALTAALQREQDDRRAERRLLTGDADEAHQQNDLGRRWRWPWARR